MKDIFKIKQSRLEEDIILSPITTVAVNSPAELKPKFDLLRKNRQLRSRNCAVASINDNMLLRLFNVQNISPKDIKQHLLAEAADLLSLKSEEIDLDYQIFNSDQNKTEGVFICAPKTLVNGFLSELDKEKIIPLQLSDAHLVNVESFLNQHRKINECFCLLDFTREKLIHLSVFANRRCRFLRKVAFENMNEAKVAIDQSLWSALAHSQAKKFDAIYFLGDTPDKEHLIFEIKKNFETKIEFINLINPLIGLGAWNPFFHLNLFRDYTFSLKARTVLLISIYLLIYFLLIQCVFLAIDIHYQELLTNILQKAYTYSDYLYGLHLESQLQ